LRRAGSRIFKASALSAFLLIRRPSNRPDTAQSLNTSTEGSRRPSLPACASGIDLIRAARNPIADGLVDRIEAMRGVA
jgi:hypothetical protein